MQTLSATQAQSGSTLQNADSVSDLGMNLAKGGCPRKISDRSNFAEGFNFLFGCWLKQANRCEQVSDFSDRLKIFFGKQQ